MKRGLDEAADIGGALVDGCCESSAFGGAQHAERCVRRRQTPVLPENRQEYQNLVEAVHVPVSRAVAPDGASCHRTCLLTLPQEALFCIFGGLPQVEVYVLLGSVCVLLSRLAADPQLWAPTADADRLSPVALQRLAEIGAFARCQALSCCHLWAPAGGESPQKTPGPAPHLKALELTGDGVGCSECFRALADLPDLERLTLRSAVGSWPWGKRVGTLTGVSLRSLKVETKDPGFVSTAPLWTSKFCPQLEELCWSIDPLRASKPQRRQTYSRFLRLLGRGLSPDFLAQRASFRVSCYNGVTPPQRLTVRCSICLEVLFRSERIFALGPGTQSHIDCEAFVWGASAGDLRPSVDDATQIHCRHRCHESAALFLVAKKGSFIDTCGFNYACACGPDLAIFSPSTTTDGAAGAASASAEDQSSTASAFGLAPGHGSGSRIIVEGDTEGADFASGFAAGFTSGWFTAFLRQPGSLVAPRRFRTARTRAS